MPEKHKMYEGGLFFVTLSVVGWIDVFTRKIYAEILIDNLNYCIAHKGLQVYAFCIMPSHLHMVASVERGLLTQVLRDFKSYVAKQIITCIKEPPRESRHDWLLYMFTYFAKKNSHNAQYQFWQQRNHPVSLETNYFIDQKVNYIHDNPVRAGLVNEPHNYIFSSANPFTSLKLSPL